jgi:hypothetical protein
MKSKYRNVLHFFSLILLGSICFFLGKLHNFANPVPSDEYYAVFFFQFLLVFIGYSISFRLGRVLLITGVFLLSRLSSFAYPDSQILVVGGFFTGGVMGLAFKIYLDYSNVSPFVRSIHDRFTFTRGLEYRGVSFVYFPIILFLSVLLIDRFINYFHFPLLTGTDIQDYFYFPNEPSRSLYSLSANIIIPMLYALIYFYAEERSFYNYNQGAFRDFGEGILYAFAIQSIVIFIQTFISLDFLAQGTNNAPALGRATGLFRDAGSATWMFPLLLIYSLHYAVKELNISHPKHILFLSLFLLFLGGILGFRQGRAYNLILFSSFVLFHLKNLKRYKNNLGIFQTLAYVVLLLWATTVGFYFFAKFTNEGKLWNLIISFTIGDSFIARVLELDPARTYLNEVALRVFSENPILGGGIAGVTVSLKNPNFSIPNPLGVVDGPGSLYTGLPADVGILGTIAILLWVGLQIYWRSHLSFILYLIIPMLFGYHISHPDGAVFILLLIGPLHRLKIIPDNKSKYVSISIIVISLLFFIKPVNTIFSEKKVPLFRESTNSFYQISYYSQNIEIKKEILYPDSKEEQDKKIMYHSFRGKLIWKIKNKAKLKSCAFLGEETGLETTRMRWTYFDENYEERGHEDMSISKYDTSSTINIPESASFVRLEELNSADFPMNRGTIFNVRAECFSDKNEYLGQSL